MLYETINKEDIPKAHKGQRRGWHYGKEGYGRRMTEEEKRNAVLIW